MIIKKFVAETMNEALAQVKQELGEDAVILQSKKVEKTGLFKKSGGNLIEVTAATPDRNPPPPRMNRPKLDERMKETLEKSSEKPDIDLLASTLGTKHRGLRRSEMPVRAPKLSEKESDFGKKAAKSMAEMKEQLAELRETVKDLTENLTLSNGAIDNEKREYPKTIEIVFSEMLANGMSEKNARIICNSLLEENSKKELSEDQLEEEANERISKKFNVKPFDTIRKTSDKPVVVALIGPTGVGKTTTLAKLATNKCIFRNKNVAMISTDTYRVAAVEQLKTFAGIAGIDMDVVYRPEELPRSIEKYSDKDYILVDTAGRSQNDFEAIEELAQFMDAGRPDEIVLVVAANARLEDQAETLKKFSILRPTRLIVTKLDEVGSGGHLMDVAALYKREWAYLTTGQNVPDDIVAADSLLLAAMCLKKDYFIQLRENKFEMPA